MSEETPIRYSIIIPAYNEEELLPGTLTNLGRVMQRMNRSGEVIVVDNNSTDRTAEIAKSFGVKIVFEKINQISRARNAGAKEAKGKFLIFLDADTTLSFELLDEAIRLLERNACCGGGTMVRMDKKIWGTAEKILGFWNRVSRKLKLAAGCFIFCLKSAFIDIGGFSCRVYASEEIWLSLRLQEWGRGRKLPFRILPRGIVTSSRKTEDPWRMILALFMLLLFPITPLSRSLSWFWYVRVPNKSVPPQDHDEPS